MAAITAPVAAMGNAGAALGGPGLDALKDVAAAMKEVGKVVSDTLLPPLKLLADGIKSTLGPAIKSFSDVIRPLTDRLKAVGEVVKFGLSGALEIAGEAVKDFVKDWTPLKSVMAAAGGAAVMVAGVLTGGMVPALAGMAVAVGAFVAGLAQEFDGFGGRLKAVGAIVGGVAATALSKFGEYAKAVAGATFEAAASMGKAVGSLGKFAVGAVGAVMELGQAIKDFVAKANPAAVVMFDLAVADMMAVIGQALLPVFKLATEVVRMFADTIATFVGPMGDAIGTTLRPLVGILGTVFEVFGRIGQAVGDAMQAVAPAFAGIADVVGALLEAIRPLFDLLVNVVGGALGGALKLLGGLLEMVIPPVLAFARAIGDVIKWVVDGVRSLLSMIGIDLPDKPGTEKGKSVGAATRSASTTDIDSVLRKARENAFSLGTGATDPASKTASATASMKARADEIHKWLTTELPNILKSLPAELAKAIANATGEAAMSAVDAVADPLLGSRAERSARADEVLGAVRPGATGPVAGVLDIFERMRGRHGDGSGTVAAAT